MRINLDKVWIFSSFIIVAFVTAMIDYLLINVQLSQLIIFPLLFLLIYFFTRYNHNRYIYLNLFLFVYFIIMIIPLWLGVILLILIFVFEKILNLILNRFNVIQVLSISFFITTLVSLIYFYNLSFLKLFDWYFINMYLNFKDFMQDYLVRLGIIIVIVLLFYPLLSTYEGKNKLFLNKS